MSVWKLEYRKNEATIVYKKDLDASNSPYSVKFEIINEK